MKLAAITNVMEFSADSLMEGLTSSMNIQSSFDPGQPLREPAAARPAANLPGTEAQSGTSARSAVIADGDTASISDAALAAASGLSDVRTEKVAAVQQALAGGSYTVSPLDVAEKLIDHLLQG
jgi:negative regulator of flagellin synthesis FlgM